MTYTDTYTEEKDYGGKSYERFIESFLDDYLGWHISVFKDKELQYNIGESFAGIEIKFDEKFAETGNLYIETHECRDPENPRLFESGILRENNTWLWLQGNHEKFWIFSLEDLRRAYDKKKANGQTIQIKRGTSAGFLLLGRVNEMDKYALIRIDYDEDRPKIVNLTNERL